MRTLHLILIVALIAIGLGPAVHPALAQGDGGGDTKSCTQLVQQVLTDIGTNCADLGPNSACYASKQVTRTFVDETTAATVFSQPGDQTDVTSLASISTAPFNADDSEWGLSVIQTRANLHNAIDDTVTYILFGDVQIENRVAPEDALQPVEPVSLTTTSDADVYRQADATSEQLGTVPAGTEVEVDAVSPNGQWGRIVYSDDLVTYTAWVQLAALETGVNLDALPTVEADTFAPMQNIYLSNGYDTPDCSNALAPMMLIQAPENTQVDLRINDIDMRLESTVLLRVLPPGDRLEIIVLDGLLFLFPGTARQVIVPPGHRSTGCQANRSLPGGPNGATAQNALCPFDPPVPLAEENLQLLIFLNLLPLNILHYRIVIPIIILGSGVGIVIITIILPPLSLRPVCRLCSRGGLPDNICERYRCPVP